MLGEDKAPLFALTCLLSRILLRAGEAASVGLTEALQSLGFETDRLKTGTPARIDMRTVDFGVLEQQPGDEEVRNGAPGRRGKGREEPWTPLYKYPRFKMDPTLGQRAVKLHCPATLLYTPSLKQACHAPLCPQERWFSFDPEVHVPRPQMPCYLTRTTADTHRLIRENLKETPIYGGWVDSKVRATASVS